MWNINHIYRYSSFVPDNATKFFSRKMTFQQYSLSIKLNRDNSNSCQLFIDRFKNNKIKVYDWPTLINLFYILAFELNK